MGDPGQAVMAIMALAVTAVGSYTVIALVQVLVKRLSGTGKAPDHLRAELDDLRARVEEGEQARYRIAELEERLDFAERMLAQQREQPKLSAGREAP